MSDSEGQPHVSRTELQNSNTPVAPLNYAPAEPGPTAGAIFLRIVLFCVGAGLGVFLIFWLGAGVFDAAGYQLDRSVAPNRKWPIVLFVALVIATGAGATLFLKKPHRNWFLIGISIGSCMMCLLETYCFANP